MARRPQQHNLEPEEQERIEVLNASDEIPDATLPDVGSEPRVVGNALDRAPKRAEELQAQVRYFRVLRGGYFLDRSGVRALMREGKEIDNLNYDIRRLQQQGIKLQEINEADRTAAIVW